MTLAEHTLTTRLDELRGDAPATRHNARTIAALTANPGCARRALLDAAAVDKTVIAQELGFPPKFGQSPFAITRGNTFEAMVKAHGCAELLRLLREELELTIPEVGYHDLETVGDNASNSVRYQRTKQLLGQALTSGQGTLFDHPMLRLEIAGAIAYLEPDVVALQIGGLFHVVEIKSFAVVDGQADPAQVASAARQSAVYVLAMRELLRELGHSPDLVAHNSILVCAKDFTNRPTAALVDLRKQLAVIGRQLSRLTSIDTLLDLVPRARRSLRAKTSRTRWRRYRRGTRRNVCPAANWPSPAGPRPGPRGRWTLSVAESAMTSAASTTSIPYWPWPRAPSSPDPSTPISRRCCAGRGRCAWRSPDERARRAGESDRGPYRPCRTHRRTAALPSLRPSLGPRPAAAGR